MADPQPGTPQWHALIQEPIIDPERVIVDPHHHLWHHAFGSRYLLEDLWADTDSGHNIAKTVYVECGSFYREEGPEHLRPAGETEAVAEVAKTTREQASHKAVISGIVGRADLRLGDAVEEVLDAHRAAGGALFKGIRHAGAFAREPDALVIKGRAPEGLYADNNFRRGLTRLGELGYSYDTWHYHYQNPDFAALARAVPGTTMILDHFGTPLGVGPYAEQREEIFTQWQKDIAEIAACPNVVAKLGGLAMPDNGFGWHTAAAPPDSLTFANAQRRYYLHAIDVFGPERCMFESNFPVDRLSISYHVLWNGLKRIVNGFNDAEQNAMFSGTASRIYRLS
jgi:predicted TIM-barrel fold metal-dependent hydrolase